MQFGSYSLYFLRSGKGGWEWAGDHMLFNFKFEFLRLLCCDHEFDYLDFIRGGEECVNSRASLLYDLIMKEIEKSCKKNNDPLC